jgi:hypothetical protein
MQATAADAQRLGPNMTMLAAAGAAAGLFAGLALAALRYRRQSRLAEELEEMPVDLHVPDLDRHGDLAVEPFVIEDVEIAEPVIETAAFLRGLPDDHLYVTDEVVDFHLEERVVANDTLFGDRIRSLLADHQQPAERSDLPPLMAALVEQSHDRFVQGADHAVIDFGSSDPGYDMEELAELQRELAELRELVRIETAARALKATG